MTAPYWKYNEKASDLIYESKFSDGSYGYRPHKSAKDAILKVKKYADEGYISFRPAFFIYFFNIFCSGAGIKITRVLFLQFTTAFPLHTASTVIYGSPETRILVPHMVCII